MLAVTVIAVCVLALVGGLLYDMKAGFCNAVCPVLPVERLYGQRPLLKIPNARCIPCTVCTKTACLDLNSEKSGLLSLGPGSSSSRWAVTGFGAFALAFPGFVIAYYRLADVGLAQAGSVYATVALWSVGSWLVLASAFTLLRVPVSSALLVCAALAVGSYYWFAPPGIAAEFGLPATFTWIARALTLGLVGLWFVRGLGEPANRRPPASQGTA